jgi:hypothetical protein
MTDQREAGLKEVGKNALASIREMVAALECDYDRLEELRELMNDRYEDLPDADDDHEQTSFEHYLADMVAQGDDDAEELAELEAAAAGCDAGYPCKDQDDARNRIQEDALSLRIFGERVEGDWQADRFELLLATGGPAIRIMGELDGNNEPHRAWLEVQDWGTPWTEYYETGVGDLCLAYSRCFCFE